MAALAKTRVEISEAKILISHLEKSGIPSFKVMAVVFIGMGQDGMRGAEVIREAVGQVMAQNEASSVEWGKSRAGIQAGSVHSVLLLSQVSIDLMKKVRA